MKSWWNKLTRSKLLLKRGFSPPLKFRIGGVSKLITEGVIVAVVTTILSPLVAFFLKRGNENLEKIANDVKEIKVEVQKTKDGTLEITKFRLLQEMKVVLNQNFITVNKLKEISDLYGSYVNLGGNSAVSDLFEKCQNLPIKEK